MSDNKIDEVKKAVEQTMNAANKAKSGNVLGAAKELLKNNQAIKKSIKRAIISTAMQILPIILVAIIMFSIGLTMANAMIELLSNVNTKVSGLWRWITDDYWIDLAEKIEYTDEDGNTEKETIIDKYIRELGDNGVSIKELRLLGEADYSDMENLLADGKNKEIVEKYISEFVRADLITQEFHKRKGSELVSLEDQNLIDGGIYLFRTKKEETLSEDQFENGNYDEQNVQVKDKDLKQMEYIEPEKFEKLVKNNDPKIRYKFTIDRDTQELLVGKITTTTVVEADISNAVNTWFANIADWLSQFDISGLSTYKVETIRIPYKEVIAKYTMPYEFLINLCEMTQNPEFAYHVALLARNTKIVLAIQDNTTINRETIEKEKDRLYYKNYDSSSSSGASVSGANPRTKKTRKTTTVIEQTPVLRIEYADTWSFYDEFEYTKNISGEITEEGPEIERPAIPSSLSGYQPEIKEKASDYAASGAYVTVSPEYWYDTFDEEIRTSTQVITTQTTYNETEQLAENSVEKSKQFLGLLRNSDGKCSHDCFEHEELLTKIPIAIFCSNDAVFDRSGINVQYKIPNMERTESPLNKLTSALGILYSTMETKELEEGKEEEDYEAEQDYESIYNQKMQGLVDHLRYLMTFPENESYTIKNLLLDILFDNDKDNNYDYDIIVDQGQIASAREIYNFLIGKGFTPEGACAIIGNIQRESNFNTAASNGTHFGLIQWGDGRWERLKNFASQRGTNWTDLNTQLEYLWFELCGTYSNVKNAIINSTDLEYATDYFCRKYEICGSYGTEVPKRYGYAKYWYRLFVEGSNENTEGNINNGEITDTQNALLNVLINLSDYSGIENEDGYCQRFVRTVYEKLGISGSAVSASNAESKWKVSTDMSNIPVGATVYGRGSSADGHVGIYIGNGMVVHNIGNSHDCSYGGVKGIKCEDINSWDSKYKFTSWGWQGGVDLSK